MPGGERLRSRHAALLVAAGALLACPLLAAAAPIQAEATDATTTLQPAPPPPEIDAFLAFLDKFLGQLLPPPLPPLPPLAPQPVVPPTPAAVLAVVPVAAPVTTTTVPEPVRMLRPVPGNMTRGFGYDGGHFHKGLDLDGETGDRVVAAKAGTVVATSCGGGYGMCTVIDHGHGLSTWYAHLSRQTITSGPVARGQVIGLMGCTGSCTGSHLHWEVHVDGAARDPMKFL